MSTRARLRDAAEIGRGLVHVATSMGGFAPARVPAAIRESFTRRHGPLGALLAIHTNLRPDSVATVDSNGSRTYAELDERSGRLARVLSDEGVRRGRVAFVLPNCNEAIETLGAAARLGLAPVPVNPRFSADELAWVLESQGATAAVVDAAHAEGLGRFRGPVIVRGDDYEERLRSADRPPPPAASDGEHKLVIQTSGTTGRPKGAERDLMELGGATMLALFARLPVRHDDVVLLPAPLFHALGLGGAMMALGLGGTIVHQERFDPDDLVSLAETHHATGLVLVPVMLRRLVDTARDRGLAAPPEGPFGTLRWALVSGSALPVPLARDAEEVLGPIVRNLYGSTEAGFVSIAMPRDLVDRPGTVGRPLPGVAVAIVDGDGGDGIGEITVRSRTVFEGYTGEEAAVRGEVYPMGDHGRLDGDGYLFVADRADDMVITGGENVYPAEVERVLLELPDIADAAVIGVPDEQYGQALAAFVTAAPDSEVDPEAVRAACRDRLANFKVPKKVWVVDELPYNATGKVLRRVLRDDAAERLGSSGE